MSRAPVVRLADLRASHPHVVAKAGRAGAKPKGMNKTEESYGEHLELQRYAGRILSYAFEAVTLKLADDTRYTPDYLVIAADATVELHEVKGRWEDDARVKIKVAARLFPFRFIAVTKRPARDGGGWNVEEFAA